MPAMIRNQPLSRLNGRSTNIPTREALIAELDVFKTHTNPEVAQQATVWLSELNALTPDSEDAANKLGNRLHSFVMHPNKNDPLTETAYRMLLVVTHICPRNCRENGRSLDPITHQEIEPNDLFISMDRYQWSLQNIARYVQSTGKYINPLTRGPFTSREIEQLNRVSTANHNASPSLPAEPIEPRQEVESDETCCCFTLFSFFRRAYPQTSRERPSPVRAINLERNFVGYSYIGHSYTSISIAIESTGNYF